MGKWTFITFTGSFKPSRQRDGMASLVYLYPLVSEEEGKNLSLAPTFSSQYLGRITSRLQVPYFGFPTGYTLWMSYSYSDSLLKCNIISFPIKSSFCSAHFLVNYITKHAGIQARRLRFIFHTLSCPPWLANQCRHTSLKMHFSHVVRRLASGDNNLNATCSTDLLDKFWISDCQDLWKNIRAWEAIYLGKTDTNALLPQSSTTP